ncbi:MAG: hypothetical protein IH840_15145 [Candidatus Heimdallarchaeota archaeon]|nr:hypothetical protein [Candidatus Heimdallarchaeota archaeon]
MARHFVFGNGNILVCQDENAQIRDFYYPYVGQENHVSGKEHKNIIGYDLVTNAITVIEQLAYMSMKGMLEETKKMMQ